MFSSCSVVCSVSLKITLVTTTFLFENIFSHWYTFAYLKVLYFLLCGYKLPNRDINTWTVKLLSIYINKISVVGFMLEVCGVHTGNC